MSDLDRIKLRLGALALILSAFLILGGLILRGPLLTDVSDARAFAESVASPNNLIAETFLPFSLVIQLFGFLGMYAYLDRNSSQANGLRQERQNGRAHKLY